ncbi:MAG: LysR family transcriptional regulator [Sandaracinus sp.]
MLLMFIMRPTHIVDYDAGMGASSLDLDLLRVFDHLHREKHLTRAGRLLGLSQPAVSRALVRLRDALGDPLFVRGPRGVVPTPRADALAPEVREILRRTAALTQPSELDPAQLERTFVFASVDFLEGDLLPRLSALLEREAPRVSITSRPLGPDATEGLTSGRYDLAIGVPSTLPTDAMTTHLFDDDFVCVVRRGHPSVRRALDLATFCRLSHVLISPRGEPGSPVDDALAKKDLSRHVAIRTHTFFSAPHVVASSDLVLTGPARVLEPLAKNQGLRVLPPPLPLRGFGVHMAWHARVQNDPAHAWLRSVIKRAAARAGSTRARRG